MQKSDAEPADVDAALPKAVERGFARPPVITVAPPCDASFELGEQWRLARLVDCLAIGPARLLEPPGEVIEVRLRNRESKRDHGRVVGANWAS